MIKFKIFQLAVLASVIMFLIAIGVPDAISTNILISYDLF